MQLRMRLEMQLLEETQLTRLLDAALRVWREVPFLVQGPDEFLEPLRDFGCRIDGEHVHFPQPVVDKVMACAAATKARWLEAGRAADLEWAPSELRMYTHGQALSICDLETNALRPATQADLAAWCHAVDAFGDVSRAHPTFIPTDVPRGAADFHAFATIMLNSREPHRVSVYCANMLPFFVEATRIATGADGAALRDAVFATKCWVTSPFKLTRENIEIALAARRLLGRPVQFGNMPVAGASSPVTLAGSVVQNTAESLALCAMSMAINGAPRCSVTGTTTMMDMRDACHRQSGPDVWLQSLAASEMRAHIFGGRPSAAFSATAIGAQTVSPQSVYEKALIHTFNIAAGVRNVGIGSLACSDVGSPVQLFLDYEMGEFYRHMLRDVTIDDARVGLDTILATAPRGAYYLETRHTAEFFRESCWLPAFVDNRVPLAWLRDPADMIQRARERARSVFATAENQCPLPDAQRAQIQALMADAAKLARG